MPAGRHGVPALRAPQQHTLGGAMHNGGQGLQAQIGFVLPHSWQDNVTPACLCLASSRNSGKRRPLSGAGPRQHL